MYVYLHLGLLLFSKLTKDLIWNLLLMYCFPYYCVLWGSDRTIYSVHSKLEILEMRLSTLGLTAYWRPFSLRVTLVPLSGLILKMHLFEEEFSFKCKSFRLITITKIKSQLNSTFEHNVNNLCFLKKLH